MPTGVRRVPRKTVHTDVDDGGLANFSYTSTDGNPSSIAMTFTPVESQIGDHVIHFTASDDFVPPGVTETDLTIHVVSFVPTKNITWSQLKVTYR